MKNAKMSNMHMNLQNESKHEKNKTKLESQDRLNDRPTVIIFLKKERSETKN